MKLLLVEDEVELLNTLGKNLTLAGYSVDLAPDGETAVAFLDVEKYDLVILDINLPGISGLEVLTYAVRRDSSIRILILTAYSDIDTKVKGLDLGASDYMTKPFEFRELEARIRMLLRRSYVQLDPVLVCGDLKFDTVRRILTVKDEAVFLTKKETSIIEYMMMNQNRLVSVDDILSHAWDSESDSMASSVRVHLTTLRRKIKDALGWNPIRNRVGEGYYISSEPEDF